jgi:hypothetical protein
VRQTCGMKAFHGACYFYAESQVVAPTPEFSRIYEFRAVMGSGKPFSLLIPTLDTEHVIALGAELEKEFLPVAGSYEGGLSGRGDSHDVRRPAINGFPKIPTCLIEDIFPVFSNDVLETFERIRILFAFENLDDIALVGGEIDIFHTSTASMFGRVVLVAFTGGEGFDRDEAHSMKGAFAGMTATRVRSSWFPGEKKFIHSSNADEFSTTGISSSQSACQHFFSSKPYLFAPKPMEI